MATTTQVYPIVGLSEKERARREVEEAALSARGEYERRSSNERVVIANYGGVVNEPETYEFAVGKVARPPRWERFKRWLSKSLGVNQGDNIRSQNTEELLRLVEEDEERVRAQERSRATLHRAAEVAAILSFLICALLIGLLLEMLWERSRFSLTSEAS